MPGTKTCLLGEGLVGYAVAMLLHVVTSQDWTEKVRPMARIVVMPPARSGQRRLEGAVPGAGASQNAHFSALPWRVYIVACMMFDISTVDRVTGYD